MSKTTESPGARYGLRLVIAEANRLEMPIAGVLTARGTAQDNMVLVHGRRCAIATGTRIYQQPGRDARYVRFNLTPGILRESDFVILIQAVPNKPKRFFIVPSGKFRYRESERKQFTAYVPLDAQQEGDGREKGAPAILYWRDHLGRWDLVARGARSRKK